MQIGGEGGGLSEATSLLHGVGPTFADRPPARLRHSLPRVVGGGSVKTRLTRLLRFYLLDGFSHHIPTIIKPAKVSCL